MSNSSRKKNRTIIPIVIGIVVLLLALVIAFGCTLATSANRALGLITNASEDYSEAYSSLEDGNFEGAYKSARSAVDNISALRKELDSPQWNIAAMLPVVGDDVKSAREMSSIAGKLADEAISPAFDQWDSLTQTLIEDNELNVIDRANAFLDELSKFTDTLSHAKQVLYECEEQAKSLPEAHNDQLKEVASELERTLTTTGVMLRMFDRLAESIVP